MFENNTIHKTQCLHCVLRTLFIKHNAYIVFYKQCCSEAHSSTSSLITVCKSKLEVEPTWNETICIRCVIDVKVLNNGFHE